MRLQRYPLKLAKLRAVLLVLVLFFLYMFIFKSSNLLQKDLRTRAHKMGKVGFVPTMGALHLGHLALIQRARAENDTLVVSIFVNPKQFDDKQDLDNYPNTITDDIKMLLTCGVDYLFYPDADSIYGESYEDKDIELNGLDTIHEGALRPGHFQGVAKVVKRFFEIVEPVNAYFGQKGFQQTVVINRLIQVMKAPINMVVCPIVREHHGLAMSSRNERLTPDTREKAAFIYKALIQLKERTFFKSLEDSLKQTVKYLHSIREAQLEYLICVNGETLQIVNDLNDASYVVALTVVRMENVRLLDNIILKDNRQSPSRDTA